MSIITMITKSASFATSQCITEHQKRTTAAPSLPSKTRSHSSRNHKVKVRVRAKTKARNKAQVKAKAASRRNQPNQSPHLSLRLKSNISTTRRPMLTTVAGSTR